MSFNQAISASLSSMKSGEKHIAQIGGNVGNADTDGYVAFSTIYNDIIASGAESANGVEGKTRILMDKRGSVQNTGVTTDLALKNGRGMIIAREPGKEDISLMRTGSFRSDKEGKLVTAYGHILQGWKLDENGNLPATKGLTSSLNDVEIGNLRAGATATTEATANFNLDSKQLVIGGGVLTLDVANTAGPNNNIGSDDIIAPTAQLVKGGGLTFIAERASGKEVTENEFTYLYGGIAESQSFSNAGTGLVGTPTDELKFSVGGTTIAVTRGSGAGNLDVLNNIADQINTNSATGVNGVRAGVAIDGANSRLLISPSNPNNSLTFSTSGNTLGADLDLIGKDIEQARSGEQRFATLADLESYLKQNSSIESDATVASGGKLFIKANSVDSIYVGDANSRGDFAEALFGNSSGQYFNPDYDPYDPKRNIAGGHISPQFSKKAIIYDSLGNSHALMVGMIKLDTNKWAAEIYAADPSEIQGRSEGDGLLQAGIVTFNKDGNIQGAPEPVSKAVNSTKGLADVNALLGASAGQNLTMDVSGTAQTFNYVSAAESNGFTAIGTTITAGGTFAVQVGSTTHNFTTAGADDGAIITDLVDKINATSGVNALRASQYTDGGGNMHLRVWAEDPTKNFALNNTATPVNGQLFSATVNYAADNLNFNSLGTLVEAINHTDAGLQDKLTASTFYDTSTNSYHLRILPQGSNIEISFGGGAGVINPPLGDGTTTTSIADAFGLQDLAEDDILTGLAATKTITWSNKVGASDSFIKWDWIENGGLRQVNQIPNGTITSNGSSTGELKEIAIDDTANVIAIFNNGKQQSIYKLPIGDVSNAAALTPVSGNAFKDSVDSGPLILKEAGENGAALMDSGALEGSNVDVAGSLSEMMRVKMRYQASSKVMSVVNGMTEELITRVFG